MKSFENIIVALTDYFNRQKDYISKLEKQIRDYDKEKRVSELHDEINLIRQRTPIIFSEIENERFKKFRHKHYKKGCTQCAKDEIQMNLTYTGIGIGIKLTCPVCGGTDNITDIDNW